MDRGFKGVNSRDGEKWMGLGYIFKTKATEFADKSDM